MSPAATLDDETARAAILASADEVFYARGIAGVSMADVRDHSGVSLRRLYALYPSKRALVAGWLSNRHETWMGWFSASIERRRAEGVDPLLAAFDAIGDWAVTPGYRGCAFINVAAESAEIDDTHRHIVAAHKEAMLAYVVSLASGAGHADPERIGHMVGVLLDGAMAQAAVLHSPEPVRVARQAASVLIGAPT